MVVRSSLIGNNMIFLVVELEEVLSILKLLHLFLHLSYFIFATKQTLFSKIDDDNDDMYTMNDFVYHSWEDNK